MSATLAGRRRAPNLRALGRALDRLAFGGLLLLLLAAPWPLGGNRPWAMAALTLGAWLSLVLALAGYVGGRPWPVGLRRSLWPMTMAAGFCVLVALQAWAGAPDGALLRTLSPWHTQGYLLRALCFTGAMALAVLTVRSRQRCTWVLSIVLVAGLAQAVLAVMLLAGGTNYDFMFENFSAGGRASGTFVNPNHFAGYLALASAAGIGLLMARFDGREPELEGWRMQVVSALSFLLSMKMLLRLALVTLVIALVITHSRMGNLAFFASILLAGGLVAVRSRRLRRPALWLVGTMVVIDLLVIGQWVGFDRIAERLQATPLRAPVAEATTPSAGLSASPVAVPSSPPLPREESLEERLQVPALALPLVLQRPWLGHGGGTFHLVFAPVKPETVFAGTWTHAHNDYVEVATDMGVPALLLWLGIGIFSVRKAWRLLPDGQPRLNRGVGVATLIAIIATGLHSWVDFGLQIPAIALTFSVMLTLAWIVAGLPMDVRRSTQQTRSRQ